MILATNGAKHNTRKKLAYDFRILLKIWFWERVDFIENDDVTPNLLLIKWSKLWKLRKVTEITVDKFCEKFPSFIKKQNCLFGLINLLVSLRDNNRHPLKLDPGPDPNPIFCRYSEQKDLQKLNNQVKTFVFQNFLNESPLSLLIQVSFGSFR